MNWQPLDLVNIPNQSGVYAFKNGSRWLYIGQSQNLSQRLTNNHIPLQIARHLPKPVDFLYQLSKSPGKLEYYLINSLEPEWNGRTSFEPLAEQLLGIYCSGWSCHLKWFADVPPMSREEINCGKTRPLDTIARYTQLSPNKFDGLWD